MNVLVTGHAATSAPTWSTLLKQHGHTVTGVDLDLFEGCAWEPATPPDRELVADVRALNVRVPGGLRRDLPPGRHLERPDGRPGRGADAVGQPRRARSGWPRSAKQAGVPRFLFSGSCSVYGKGETLDLDEDRGAEPADRLRAAPRSRPRRRCGRWPTPASRPVFLRNATAYGDSPMLRIDLVVNNLLACALRHGRDPDHERRLAVAAAGALPRHRPRLRRTAWRRPREPLHDRRRQHRRQHRELPGAGRGRPGAAAAAVGRDQLHRRGRRRSRATTGSTSTCWAGCCRTSGWPTTWRAAWTSCDRAYRPARLLGRRLRRLPLRAAAHAQLAHAAAGPGGVAA